MLSVSQAIVDILTQRFVLFRVGRVIVIVADHKIVKVAAMFGVYFLDEFFRRDSKFLGPKHGGCAMGVISTDVDTFMAAHTLKANPDIRLDMLHQMSKVNRPVGIRKGTGDQNTTLFHESAIAAEFGVLSI